MAAGGTAVAPVRLAAAADVYAVPSQCCPVIFILQTGEAPGNDIRCCDGVLHRAMDPADCAVCCRMGNKTMNAIVRNHIMISNGKTLLLSRVLLLIAVLGILVISLFTSDPDTFTVGHTFEPLWEQVLITGGIAVLIVLYCWWWPGFGGAVAVIYGSLQILGDFRIIQSGHIETAVPISVYYGLYALLIAGGLIGIVASLRRKAALVEDTDISYRLRKIALITNLSSVGTVIVLGIVALIIALTTRYSPDHLLGSFIYLVPASLITAWIVWMWPAQGGLLEIIIGVFWLVLATIPNWELLLFIPYAVICGLLITAGCLNIARGYLIRQRPGVNV